MFTCGVVQGWGATKWHHYTYDPQAVKLDASRGVGGIVVELQDLLLPPRHRGITEEVWESNVRSVEL